MKIEILTLMILAVLGGEARADTVIDPALNKSAWVGQKLVKRKCGACHSFSEVPRKRMGPGLFGIVGRPAGSSPEYRYSTAMSLSNITWTRDALDQYLQNPGKMIPGNKMRGIKVRSQKDRTRILDYLETLREKECLPPKKPQVS